MGAFGEKDLQEIANKFVDVFVDTIREKKERYTGRDALELYSNIPLVFFRVFSQVV